MTDDSDKKKGVNIEVPTKEFKLTAHPPTISANTAVAAAASIADEPTKAKIYEADEVLKGLDRSLLVTLGNTPTESFRSECGLTDKLSLDTIAALANGELEARRANIEARRYETQRNLALGGLFVAVFVAILAWL